MAVTSAQFTNADETQIKFVLDGVEYHAPYPIQNWHAAIVEEWIGLGNTVDVYVAPPAPTVYVTKLQIIDNLITANKLNDALTALNSDVVLKARWDAATMIATDDQDVIDFITALSLDPEDILQ